MMMLEKPTETVLTTMNRISYLFVLLALAAGISWIYYVAKAVDQKEIGGADGDGDGTGNRIESIRTMFQGAVVSILLYFVARHHFRSHY